MINKKTPYTICHMMQTIDGKIASGIDDKEILMDYFDLYVEYEDKAKCKSFMFGRKTAEMFAEVITSDGYKEGTETNGVDFLINTDKEHFAVITDSKGKLEWKNNFINLSGNENNYYLIIIVNKSTKEEYLNYLRSKNIAYIHTDDSNSLKSVMVKIRDEFGIEKLLLEGGGGLNGSMMDEGLVDEISLLITPIIANRKLAPALFDLDSQEIDIKKYTLKEVSKEDGDALWLRYLAK